jgi:sugar (pentulose or hexulose) kinase
VSSVALGLDVGTTTIGAVALDLDTGRLVGRASVPNTAQSTPAPGREELDLEAAVDLARAALEAARAEVDGPVRVLAVTGQMHGVAFLQLQPDNDRRAVRPAITWRDRRVEEPHPNGGTYLDELRRRAGPDAFAATGCEPAAGFLGPSLFWLAERGELPRCQVSSIPDAVAALLGGTAPVTDPTNAAGSGIFDVAAGAWDVGLARRLGLPPEVLPPVRETGTVVGSMPADGGTARLCVGLGDHQASVLGSVREPARTVHVNIGTGGQVSVLVATFERVAGIETRPFPGGRFLLAGAGLVGGRSLAWLVDHFAAVGADLFAARADADALYAALLRLAAAVPPGADGLRCRPLFAGTRADPSLRGGFSGIGQANFSPGHITRALLEGLAEVLYELYQQIAAVAGEREQLVGSGNGVRRAPLLASILSQRFGRPLRTTPWPEEAAVGAALAAAVGIGAVDLPRAGAFVRG